ncbi:SWIM zinc finger family protein [Gorillibacterium sp. sgz500922]|uniref:SWIM zinc finger family protein n=1 Tax=Gorillibacterium sp. sgz500922 TaxID=3446694 RepID=UPI003F67E6A3
MTPVKIPINRIEALIKAMEARLEPVILARGWNYYHRGRVGDLTLRLGTQLTADVHGAESEPYTVTFDLEKPENSSCTCPYKGWCKHMAAAIFKAYTPHGRPELLFVSLQKAAGSKLKTRQASDRPAKRPPLAAPVPGGLPSDWQDQFERRFSGYTLSYQQSVEGFYEQAKKTLLPLAEGWEPVPAAFFRLHVLLFVLRRLDRFHQENGSSFMTYYHETAARTTAARCRSALAEAAARMEAAEAKKRCLRHWNETMEMARDALADGETGVSDPLDTYRILWWELFSRAEDTAEEERKLAALRSGRGLSRRVRDLLLLAECQFLILRGQDTEAMNRLDGLEERRPGDFEALLAALSGRRDWSRLLGWLRWLLPALARARQDEFHRICTFWTEAAKELNAHDEWVAAMRSLLPRSYPYYTDYLLRHRRYREWVDLQLTVRVSAESLYAADFRLVQESAPELLLPLYTQAVERAIAEKNRNAYKEAVRLLKRLRGCYKEAGQLHRWTAYIARLADKHTRLRAFQEELAKGSLLP